MADGSRSLVNMYRLVLVSVAFLAVGGFAEPIKHVPHTKVADKVFLKKQIDLIGIFYNVHEPVHEPTLKTISPTWNLKENTNLFNNITAVKIYTRLIQNGMLLPRGVPFTIYQPQHQFEAVTLFHVLFSAKTYDTFYKTALYFRDRVNEGLFVYALSVAILKHPETQGIFVPPIYEIFPSYFYNGQIVTTAQKLNAHSKTAVEHYPGTYLWEDNIVIKWNETIWPYYSKDFPLSYFTNDYHINAVYYNNHLALPFWLSDSSGPLSNYKRGEYFWYIHKQILAAYYMERLSNGLGEIPELSYDVVQQGYWSGLLYHNGIPFPSRPNYFNLNQPKFAEIVTKIKEVESRISDAIDLGYVVDKTGKLVNIRKPETIDLLGSLVEGNVDSPNPHYYSEFVGLWKYLLGNVIETSHHYVNGHVPLVVPSTLEHYQTALRDPAFYMIWKRVLKFFDHWSSYLPHYTHEELALPTVKIEKVEVDKLVTYFENEYTYVKNQVHTSDVDAKVDDVKVLVQHPVLNHKPFNVRLHVKSDVAKTVVVRLFLAPKYDSKGVEIPLHLNTQNFYQLDRFVYELPAGETVVKYESSEVVEKWTSGFHVYQKALNAYNDKGEFVVDPSDFVVGYPHRLTIPKGRVGGMPFVFMAYIHEYVAPKDTHEPHSLTSTPLAFPLDRPLYQWQVEGVNNIFFQDVHIHHKPTPEIYSPYL